MYTLLSLFRATLLLLHHFFKTHMKIKHLLIGAFLFGVTISANAQLLLNEQFNYGGTADTLTNPSIGGGVWKRHSGTGGPLQYGNASLTYYNYPDDGVGGAVSMAHITATSREDANHALSSEVNSGNVYVSFLLSVSNSGGATGDYSFHLNDSSGNSISSVFRAKMFFKDGSTAGKFKLGFAKGGAVGVATFATPDYNVNQTYMVIVKYVFNPGATNDSVYASIIDSGMLMMEPASFDITCTDITQSDLAKVKSVCIRQGTSGTGAATFDGIRVATTWADLIAPGGPSPVGSFAFNTTGQTSTTLSWTKSGSYIDATHSIVVFVKEAGSITQGSPNVSPVMYTANTDFSVGGTAYQHDAMAKCVANGDALTVNITGLTPNTMYYALAYVVRDADSVYSNAAASSVTTLNSIVPPVPVENLLFTATTQTTTTLSWMKDSLYTDSTTTTLVFVKPTSAITAGTPSVAVYIYNADPNVAGTGTTYQNDAAAKCVYNGDNDSVNLTGLTAGTTYHVLIYTARTTDTVYSSPRTGSVTSLPPPYMLYNIGQINTVSPTTGLPDSMNVRVRLRGMVYGFDQLASSNGIQFVLRDATGGTTVYSPAKSFGYTVAEGDSIEITGQVNAFRGLHEVDRLDTIITLGTAIINAPVLVTALNESTENNLVRLDSVRFTTTQTGNWPTGGNLSAITALGDTITIRVLATSGLAGKPFPAAPTFDVIGLGSQFTTTPANFNGYQIYPRVEDDVIYIPIITPTDSLLAFDLLTPGNNDSIVVTNTNMTDSVYVIWSPCLNSNGVDFAEYTFELDTFGNDFSAPLFEIPTSFSNVLPFTKADIYNVMVLNGLPYGQIFAGIWRVKAESNGLLRYSTSTYTMYLVNNVLTGLSEEDLSAKLRLYPNPSQESTKLSGLSSSDMVTVTDITGKLIFTARTTQSELTIPTAYMPSGIYFVKVQSGDAVAVKKLLVH
jgi:hypothetical protein